MFPEKSGDDLVQALSLHGTVSAVALSLSSIPEDDFSSDDDSLLQPSFPHSKDKNDRFLAVIVKGAREEYESRESKSKN